MGRVTLGSPVTSRKALLSSLPTHACGGRPSQTPSHFVILQNRNDRRPGCPLLCLPRVSPAGREPALLKAAPELLTTPSSLCLAVKLTALRWECLWRGCREGSKTWLHEMGKFTEPMPPILGFFFPHTFNQENKTSGQLQSHSSSTRWLCHLQSSWSLSQN